MTNLRSANILLGVGGSIAAYKAPFIVRLLKQHGAHVRVAMTPSAREFVSPLVLGNLAGEPVAIDMFDESIQQGGSWHIHWAHWADAMLIAPASAHLLAALAIGLCQSVVECLALALPSHTPLLIAPAMDTTMWLHPATQRNVRQLRADGVLIIEPTEGELASGLWGIGRMPEPDILIQHLHHVIPVKRKHPNKVQESSKVESQSENSNFSLAEAVASDRLTAEIELARLKAGQYWSMDGLTVLITAGPTRESLDAVRYISNRSSGKMGYSLAEGARQRGARVILISGPVALSPPEGVEVVQVESAKEMMDAVKRYDTMWDIAIAAAAVADYTPVNYFEGKLKKEQLSDRWSIELMRSPDILEYLCTIKRHNQVVVGFALEQADRLQDGIEKLHVKGCDLIVLNAFDQPNSGFQNEQNTITVVIGDRADYDQIVYPSLLKRVCAEYILNHSLQVFHRRNQP